MVLRHQVSDACIIGENNSYYNNMAMALADASCSEIPCLSGLA
jgi:hypothetical protein